MSRARVNPRVGDVFTIPYDDDRVAYGQIVDRYGTSGGHYYFAVYDGIYPRDDAPDLDEVVARPLVLLGLSTDALLQHGHWQVAGHRDVDHGAIPWPAYREGVSPPGTFDVVDHSGQRRRRASEAEAEALPFRSKLTPFVLEKAFQALHGIGDWHASFDKLLPVAEEMTSDRLLPR
jgi:hypothetical protein